MPRVATPLTETSCKAKPAAKPIKLADGGGLFLLVTPEGGRYWRLAYRFGGKQRTLALGVYPTVSLKAARAARDAAKAALAADPPVDPALARQERARAAEEAAGWTFERVGREWAAEQARKLSPSYAGQVLRRLEADIFPDLGRRPIASITAPTLLDVLRRVENRGVAETARRLRQTVGSIFRFAIRTGRAERDPTADLRGAIEPPKQRHHPTLAARDLPEFLRALDGYDGDVRTRLALRLILLTWLRTTELRGGRWDEFEDARGQPFDWDSEGEPAQWRIPAERMKKKREHIVPLSRQAVAVLRELRDFAPVASPYLFPSPGKEKVISQNTLLFALYRLGYHSRATTHGFRATASTWANEAGWNSDWIEAQLAHVEENKIRGAYNSAQYLEPRRRLVQAWADHLDGLHADGGNVVAFARHTS